jgi:F0F1-type ATP synthase epsilon subunit
MATPIEQQASIAATGGASQIGGAADMSFQHPQGGRLRITIVTPERAVLDERADFVVLPMIDGELGVLPSRAALVGQIGKGELRISLGDTTKRMIVEGGFAQVRSDVITVLTSKVREDLTPRRAPIFA